MADLTPAEIANSPSITIGGEKFFIPKLALKQNRIVVDRLKSILPVMMQLEAAAKAVKASVTPADTEASFKAMISAIPMDEETTGKVSDAVYAAITRGQPAYTRDQFDNLPCGIDELLMSLPVVMMQSFAFMQKPKEAAPGASPGEAHPAQEPAPSTSSGTELSSESVESSAGPGITPKAA